MGVLDLISRTGSKFAFVISKAVSIMQTERGAFFRRDQADRLEARRRMVIVGPLRRPE